MGTIIHKDWTFIHLREYNLKGISIGIDLTLNILH